MKSDAWIIGFICGLLLVAIICFIMAYRQKNKYGCADEYDERQNAIRGQGYKLAYFTAIILAVAGGLLDMIFDLRWVGLFPFAMAIVWISVCVFATYAILRDAYFTLRNRRKPMTIIFLVIGVANAIIGGCDILFETGWTTDGMLNTNVVNLLTGVCCCYLSCVMLCKARLDRKAAEEE